MLYIYIYIYMDMEYRLLLLLHFDEKLDHRTTILLPQCLPPKGFIIIVHPFDQLD
jgi:hypothetical protein